MYLQTKQTKHFHRYFVNRDTNESVCLCGKEKKSLNSPKGYRIPKENKYHNKSSSYNGYTYDSIKEAQYAMELDDKKRRRLIKDWTRQYQIDVGVNGEHLFKMKVDFLVILNDSSKELHEVKSAWTAKIDIFRLKLKIIEQLWLKENPNYSLFKVII